MSYREYLENIRNTPYTIKPRKLDVSNSQPTTEDLMSFSHEWITSIKEASAEVHKTSKAKVDERKQKKADVAEAEKVKLQEAEKDTPRPLIKPRKELEGVKEPWEPSYKDSAGSFMEIMDKTEGGGDYDTLFGHSQKGAFSNIKVSEMSIGELKEFTKSDGEYGQWVKGQLQKSGQKARVATPMGRYQFVGSTMAEVASEMGLSDDTIFDQRTQDRMFQHLLDKQIRAGKTVPEKVKNLRNTWEGFRSVPKDTLTRLVNRYEE